MSLRWRFSGGILFSITFHSLLISALIYNYPSISSRGKLLWKEFPLFITEKKHPFVSNFENSKNNQEKTSLNKMIFPDLVTIRKKNSNQEKTIKKTVAKPYFSLNNILTQIEKFPQRVNNELSSNKQLSAPVVSLLSLLPPENSQIKAQGDMPFINIKKNKNISNFDSNELKNYLNKLSKFLSKGWEVPIHLKESHVKMAIIFEINKNGKILNWDLENSGSLALQNSVINLMKNLQFLPALPKSYPEKTYIFGVRFSPKIKQ